MTSVTKNLPQAKNFFRVQTNRLAAYFETFTGLVEHTGPEKFPRKTTCVRRFFSENPRNWPDAKELIFLNISNIFASIMKKNFKNPWAFPNFGVKKMGSHQNHSCMT